MKMPILAFLALSSLCLRAQFIPVPNGSFETPATDFASPAMDDWLKTPPSPYWNTNYGPWEQNTGEFANVPPGQPGSIVNCDGAQAAYIVSFPGCGVFQLLSQSYQPGRSYTMTVGLTTSTYEPLTNGTTLQVGLFYLANATNQLSVGQTNVVFNSSVFGDDTAFIDFSLSVPEVKTNDPWAGKNIGLSIVSTAGFSNAGGVWDADNVRLTEGPSLASPSFANKQASFTLLSFPGLAFNVLANDDLSQPLTAWTSIGVVTNLTGSTNLTFAAGATHQFYILKQLQ